jgi:hypothetical protein
MRGLLDPGVIAVHPPQLLSIEISLVEIPSNNGHISFGNCRFHSFLVLAVYANDLRATKGRFQTLPVVSMVIGRYEYFLNLHGSSLLFRV